MNDRLRWSMKAESQLKNSFKWTQASTIYTKPFKKNSMSNANYYCKGQSSSAGTSVGALLSTFILAMVFLFSVSETACGLPQEQFSFHHMILLLDQGPVHAQFGISLAKRPIEEQRADFVDQLIRRFDTDQDKTLSREEANKSFVLRRKLSRGTAAFLKHRNIKTVQKISKSEVRTMVKQLAGQPVVFRQNDTASQADEYIFNLLDADQSQVIDDIEMASAAGRLILRDTDQDGCIGFDEVQPPQPEPDPLLINVLDPMTTAPEVTHSVFSEILRNADEKLLPQRLLKKYDKNGNGRLSPQELRWDASRITGIDQNKDGELSRKELLRIKETPLDIDLTVDVSPAQAAVPELKILKTTGRKLDPIARPGISTMMLQNATLSISYRHVDPVQDAIVSTRRKFNLLDADVNGYLDQTEIQGETLLERGLFDQMDTDDNNKVFLNEIEDYVRQQAEVKAMACRVNVYDTGSGFFQSVDHNNDGRISVREMRSMKQSLAGLCVDKKPGVSREEPARRYHIEFSRGAFQVFGPGERATRETISFNTNIAIGPGWFVGSDRNNDGDLTWDEFLGHREDFHFLDADQDGLIDPVEANRASQLKQD